MKVARVGIWRSASTLGVLSAGALLASTTSVALQDIAALLAKVPAAERWQSHMIAAPQGSVHAATIRFSGQSPQSPPVASAGVRVPALSRHRPVAIADDAETATGGQPPTPNRAAKGDLLMTRMPVAEPKRAVPASGKIWDLKDIFSAYDQTELPKVAFAAPDQRPFGAVMVAYSRFTRPGADRPTEGSPAVLVAEAGGVGQPARGGAAPATASFNLAAYAPASAAIEAPFDAVIGAAPSITPKERPATAVGWLTERKRRKVAKGQAHAWLANPLPAHAFSKKQQDCLARGIYFEARGEPERGQAAVAQVILNRVRNPAYPGTVCGVVYQNKSWRNRCQFSFACDGIRDRILSPRAWKTAQRVAWAVTSGKIWLDSIGDATHYRANYVRPPWARRMNKADTIGRHIFYRTKNGGWS